MRTFMWDDAHIQHIARHQVTPEEAEQVVENDPIDLPVQVRNDEERIPHLGVTDEGRVLIVVTTLRNEMARVASAFPANRSMRKFYAQVKSRQETEASDGED